MVRLEPIRSLTVAVLIGALRNRSSQVYGRCDAMLEARTFYPLTALRAGRMPALPG